MGDRLEGKVALITGAGMGMGREACEVFAREGARIVALDVDEAALAETAAAVTGAGGEILTCAADVADEAAVQAAVEAGRARFGGLHILYNNAGVLWRDKDFWVLDTDSYVWDRVMGINLKGMVWVCKYGVPKLVEAGGGGGRQRRLGVGPARRPDPPGRLHMQQRRRHLADPFPGRAVRRQERARQLHPPRLRDDADAGREDREPGVDRRRLRVRSPGPPGRATRIVNAALFLASDEAAYITGAELVVDGGSMVI